MLTHSEWIEHIAETLRRAHVRVVYDDLEPTPRVFSDEWWQAVVAEAAPQGIFREDQQ